MDEVKGVKFNWGIIHEDKYSIVFAAAVEGLGSFMRFVEKEHLPKTWYRWKPKIRPAAMHVLFLPGVFMGGKDNPAPPQKPHIFLPGPGPVPPRGAV